MEVDRIYTNSLNTQSGMLLDTSACDSMKNKTAVEIRELIDNLSLNEYRSQGGDRNVAKNKDVMKLERRDALLETGACLPGGLGLSEEKVKFLGAVTRQQRYPFSNNFNSKWPNRSNFFSGGNNSL
jgi:hypothetical protein